MPYEINMGLYVRAIEGNISKRVYSIYHKTLGEYENENVAIKEFVIHTGKVGIEYLNANPLEITKENYENIKNSIRNHGQLIIEMNKKLIEIDGKVGYLYTQIVFGE